MSSRVILVLILTFVTLMECLPSEGTTTRYTLSEGSDIKFIKDFVTESTLNCSHFLDDPLKLILCDTDYNKAQFGRNLKIIPTKKSDISQYLKYTKETKNVTLTPVKLKSKIILTTPKSIKRIKIATSKATPISSTKKPSTKISLTKLPSSTNPPKTKPTKTRKRKPTIHKVVTKWQDASGLYKQNIPIPNPNPEITSSSPPFSLSDLGPIAPLGTIPNPSNLLNIMPEITSHSPPYSSLSGVPDLTDFTPIETIQPSINSGDPNRPLTTFKLDMLPPGDGVDDFNSPCPSVHISSSVLQPNERQDCTDLNLVINSHVHQNPSGTRLPNPSTYDALAENVEADPLGQAAAADPVASDVGVPAGQSVVPQAAAGPGGSGGTGGNGGNGDGGAWKFPDLKHMFEAMGYLWQGLSYLLSFLRNPYLYLIPMAIFFLLGFLKVMVLFPWWIPLLILYVSIKTATKPKPAVTFYKHVHKPVKHLDGWFWNHQTKSWQNVRDYSYKRRNDMLGVNYDPNDTLTRDLQRIHLLYNGTTGVRKRFRRKS